MSRSTKITGTGNSIGVGTPTTGIGARISAFAPADNMILDHLELQILLDAGRIVVDGAADQDMDAEIIGGLDNALLHHIPEGPARSRQDGTDILGVGDVRR